jgi:hypothetical protein
MRSRCNRILRVLLYQPNYRRIPVNNGSFLDFAWHVPESGYRWIKARTANPDGQESETRWTLVPAMDGDQRVRPHRPHRLRDENAGLFRTFADLTASKDSILNFANLHGSLSARPILQPTADAGEASHPTPVDDSLDEWKRQIAALHQAVAIWDLVQAKDAEHLRHYFQTSKSDKWVRVIFDSHPNEANVPPLGTLRVQRMIAALKVQRDQSPQIDINDVFTWAHLYLCELMDQHLPKRVTPCLVQDSDSDRPQLRVIPDQLIEAIWMQAAEAISSNRVFRSCRGCRKWLEIARGTARTTRLFCSSVCRNRFYRDKQEQARQMAAAGKSVVAIAEELGADVGAVKNWIKTREE